jgi:CRISPR-associated protein Cmr5
MSNGTTPRRSREQERAAFAYQCVKNVVTFEGKSKDKKGNDITVKYQCNAKNKNEQHGNCAAYKAYVKKTPMLIKTNGLGAAFGFIKAKSDKDCASKGYAYHLIYTQTTDWLKKTMSQIFQVEGKKEEEKDLIIALLNQDSQVYRQASVEIMALFTWLKRAAEGLIEGEAEDE